MYKSTLNRLLGAFGLSLLSFASFGQTVTVGGKIGLTRSDFTTIPTDNSQLGLTTGAGVTFMATERIGISADILYTERRFDWQERDNFFTVAERWDHQTLLKYIELPVQLMYHFGNDSCRLRPKLGVGPSISYLAVADQETDYVLTDMETSQVGRANGIYDVSDEYVKTDVGAIATAGFNFRIWGETMFTADARYYWGARNVSRISPEDIKTRNWSFLVGFAIPIN